MKPYIVFLGAIALMMGSACKTASKSSSLPPPSETAAQWDLVPARITKLNTDYRFVVLEFSTIPLPAAGTQLNVYRGVDQVGVLQITEPVRGRFATADILEGEVQVGDEVR